MTARRITCGHCLNCVACGGGAVDAFREGFDAGFDASGEGFNGEYPWSSGRLTTKHREDYEKLALEAEKRWKGEQP